MHGDEKGASHTPPLFVRYLEKALRATGLFVADHHYAVLIVSISKLLNCLNKRRRVLSASLLVRGEADSFHYLHTQITLAFTTFCSAKIIFTPQKDDIKTGVHSCPFNDA